MPRVIGKAAESPCVECFGHYLRERFQVSGISWSKGEAPDWTMRLGDNSYAVEVTTLLESVPLGREDRKPLPHSLAIHKSLVDSIEKEALAAGILDGAYSVCFGVSVADRPDLQRLAREHVLQYVERTRGNEKAAWLPHAVPGRTRTLATLVKHHRHYPRLACAHPPVVAFEGPCRDEAQRILAERIADKATKMDGLQLPRVLLLWDATSLLESDFFLGAKTLSTWRESIEAAFLVRGGDVHELWSRIEEWQGRA